MTVRYTETEAYYPIEVLIPRSELTIAEAKELVDKLMAEIEIAEWSNKSRSITEKNHWSQDYLQSFNDDGLSIN